AVNPKSVISIAHFTDGKGSAAVATAKTVAQNRAIAEQHPAYYGVDSKELLKTGMRPRSWTRPSMSPEACRANGRGNDATFQGWVKNHFAYCQWRPVAVDYYTIPDRKYIGTTQFRATLIGLGGQADTNSISAGRHVDFRVLLDNFQVDDAVKAL